MVTVRPFAAADAEAVYRLRRLAFGGPREPDTSWVDEQPAAWRGLVVDGAGFLRVWNFHQFFAGVAVPCGGVASVTVAPHARGQGVAGALFTAGLADMRENGQPISALYPAVPQLYRHYGWESVGTIEYLTVPLHVLANLPRSDVALHAATKADLDNLHAAYLRMAARLDGMLDRASPAFVLAEVLDLDVVTMAPGGYVSAERNDSGPLIVHDLVADDADTARALLRSIGSWASQLQEARISLLDPAISDLTLPRAAEWATSVHPWMLRVVDLPAAVAARGWPAVVHARPFSVDIEVVDPQAPWHVGRHRLAYDGERVTCERGGNGDVVLDARGLAAWFAGSASAAALRHAGLLTGDPDTASTLDALTGAPHPIRIGDAF
ncbi:MAG: GNAT family N-acetyltransferase [Actinomycetota bacterium]|nr:GNAT family N-acetyltransferase [Actinomycetota bacterium]